MWKPLSRTLPLGPTIRFLAPCSRKLYSTNAYSVQSISDCKSGRSAYLWGTSANCAVAFSMIGDGTSATDCFVYDCDTEQFPRLWWMVFLKPGENRSKSISRGLTPHLRTSTLRIIIALGVTQKIEFGWFYLSCNRKLRLQLIIKHKKFYPCHLLLFYKPSYSTNNRYKPLHSQCFPDAKYTNVVAAN
jgi:hypothetical protein